MAKTANRRGSRKRAATEPTPSPLDRAQESPRCGVAPSRWITGKFSGGPLYCWGAAEGLAWKHDSIGNAAGMTAGSPCAKWIGKNLKTTANLIKTAAVKK